MVSTFVKATRLKKHNWRLLAVRLRNTTTHLFNEIDCRADWNEATAIRPPEFVKATAGDIFHCKIATLPLRCFKDISVEHAHDVWMAYARKQDRLEKHFLDVLEIHPNAVKDLHCLAAKKAMLNAVRLGERSLP